MKMNLSPEIVFLKVGDPTKEETLESVNIKEADLTIILAEKKGVS